MVKNREIVDAFMKKVARIGSHCYTDGRTIWSYGSHFPMAVHAKIGGNTVTRIYYHNEKYSASTSKHQHYLFKELAFGNNPNCCIETTLANVKEIVNTDKDTVIKFLEKIVQPTSYYELLEVIDNFCKKENMNVDKKALDKLFAAGKI